jgi:hypothetical protein
MHPLLLLSISAFGFAVMIMMFFAVTATRAKNQNEALIVLTGIFYQLSRLVAAILLLVLVLIVYGFDGQFSTENPWIQVVLWQFFAWVCFFVVFRICYYFKGR